MESSLGFVKGHCTVGVNASLLTGIHMHMGTILTTKTILMNEIEASLSPKKNANFLI